jgi:hypothetical protein
MLFVYFRHKKRPREKCPDFSENKTPVQTIVPPDQLIDHDASDVQRTLPTLTEVAFKHPDNFVLPSQYGKHIYFPSNIRVSPTNL